MTATTGWPDVCSCASTMRVAWLVVVSAVSCVPSASTTFGPVDHEIQARVGAPVHWAGDDSQGAAAIEQLISKPLDLDAAVRIGFARNHRLQAQLDELGIAASDVAVATVLPPVTVDFDYKRAVNGSGSETELVAVQDLLDLLQIGQRRGIANAQLRAAQSRAVAATVALAAEIEMAFYDLIAAQQQLELVQTAFDAANASADLVERQHVAGNTSDLALVREQEQRERMRIEIGRAEQLVKERRAGFGVLLGLQNDPKWTVAGRLGDPPPALPALTDLEQSASASSLDASALRADADAAAARHRYAMIRTILPELGAGVAIARRDGGDWEVGPAIRIGIPLFNQQQGPRARAVAEQRRARNELAATSAQLVANVQATRSRVEQAFAEVRQLVDVVMPLRKRVLAETVLQYNAMNASTFELLVARRDMVDVGRQYIDALRRYWNAVAEAKALRRGGRVMPRMESAR